MIRRMIVAASVVLAIPSTIAASDPLPPHSVNRGKNLAFDIVETLLGKGVEISASYYFDYANASFQREDHFWSEGRGTRYAASISEMKSTEELISTLRSGDTIKQKQLSVTRTVLKRDFQSTTGALVTGKKHHERGESIGLTTAH